MKRYFNITLLLLVASTAYSQSSGFTDSEGVSIFYRTIGKGTPVLIINGGPGISSEGFLNVAEEIASLGYQSILFDQRGTGKSAMKVLDATTITMDLMAQDMEAIRESLGIKKWILFGHSFGGMMANYYATRYPERIMAMIHSSSGGIDLFLLENFQDNLHARLTDIEIDSLNYYQRRYSISNSEKDQLKYYQYFASAYVYNDENIPLVAQRLMLGNSTINRLVWNDLHRINYDCKEALKSSDYPVLILQGEQDVIPKELGIRADKVFSNSRLVFLEKCGHYGWLDQEAKYLSEIESFLKGIEKNDKYIVVED